MLSRFFSDSYGAWESVKSLVTGGGNCGDIVVDSSADGVIHYAYDGGATANSDVHEDAFSLRHVNLPVVVR